MTGKPQLAWTAADFKDKGWEVPDSLVGAHPEACEADFMSDEEVEAYIQDSLKVLVIMSEKNSPRLAQLDANFRADLEFLYSTGRLEPDHYNYLINLKDYRF